MNEILIFPAPKKSYDSLVNELNRNPTKLEFFNRWRTDCTIVRDSWELKPNVNLCNYFWKQLERGHELTGMSVVPRTEDLYIKGV